MLRFEKMTVKAQEALQSAQDIAATRENQAIEPVHLLSALVGQVDGVVSPLLARLGIRPELLNQELEREIGRLPRVTGFAQQNMSRALNDVLDDRFATKVNQRFGKTAGDCPDSRPVTGSENEALIYFFHKTPSHRTRNTCMLH